MIRFAGPVLVLLGLAAVAVSPPVGIAVLVVGASASVTLVPMVEVTEQAIRYRAVLGSVVLAVPDVLDVRLRRVALGPPRPPRPSGRAPGTGPFSHRPIRLRVVAGDDSIQLTVVWWSHWPDLVVRALEVSGIEPDVRTVGRLERYG